MAASHITHELHLHLSCIWAEMINLCLLMILCHIKKGLNVSEAMWYYWSQCLQLWMMQIRDIGLLIYLCSHQYICLSISIDGCFAPVTSVNDMGCRTPQFGFQSKSLNQIKAFQEEGNSQFDSSSGWSLYVLLVSVWVFFRKISTIGWLDCVSCDRLVTCAESTPASHPLSDESPMTQIRNIWMEGLIVLFLLLS